MANICEPEGADSSGHFLLPNGIFASLDLEDQEYLRRKGAFVFPESRVRESLVRAYFHYVHPFFPIVDIQDFLPKHESGALDKISTHLLWSMYLAACNVSSFLLMVQLNTDHTSCIQVLGGGRSSGSRVYK